MGSSRRFLRTNIAALMLWALISGPVMAQEAEPAPMPLIAPACLTPGMLGTAVIDDNKVITITYRGPNPQQTGYAELVYRPGTPDYEAVAAHVGPLELGQIKQIAPWTQSASS